MMPSVTINYTKIANSNSCSRVLLEKLTGHQLVKKFLNVSLTVHHELTIQNYQRDALNIIYSSNIITLLYMFRVPSTHPQEDIVVHKQHMVPSLCKR